MWDFYIGHLRMQSGFISYLKVCNAYLQTIELSGLFLSPGYYEVQALIPVLCGRKFAVLLARQKWLFNNDLRNET